MKIPHCKGSWEDEATFSLQQNSLFLLCSIISVTPTHFCRSSQTTAIWTNPTHHLYVHLWQKQVEIMFTTNTNLTWPSCLETLIDCIANVVLFCGRSVQVHKASMPDWRNCERAIIVAWQSMKPRPKQRQWWTSN